MKHFTIPVFVPELACPNRCVFCNQNSISGCYHQPDVNEVIDIIESRLKTLHRDVHIEVGFFGGNFTGIEEHLQQEYLSIAFKYLKEGKIHGIRLSTRPDYITIESLELLRQYGVTTIELGAQSLDEEVLKLAGRGHTVSDIEKASALILSHGFSLGLQMMTGLPGDTPDKSIATARKIISLGASNTRIYPTLVIKGTELAQLWLNGNYHPQTLNEAVELTATLLAIFKEGRVDVIRVGLHPSEDLVNGDDLLAGPFHVSFRQLAETELWRRRFKQLVNEKSQNSDIVIPVPEGELNNAIGYQGSNRAMLESHFKNVEFKREQENSFNLPLILGDKRMPLPAKNCLKQSGRLTLLQSDPGVYKSISGHPDIFICAAEDKVVVSPGLPLHIVQGISDLGYKVITGMNYPGRSYPSSAVYNAVITDNYLIHNLKITDPVIIKTFNDRKQLHVKQGYTRCNLLPLNSHALITSDRGIEKALNGEGMDVLFVDPSPITLKGQKHGFFPGCCGILYDQVLITGSLNYHPQKEEVVNFIASNGMKIKELFDGKLTDVGSILTFPRV